MTYRKSDPGSVLVAGNTEVAHWLRGRSRGLRRTLGALETEGRPRTVFVEDQLIVDRDDRDVIDELVSRYGAEIVPRKPVPQPPDGLGPLPGVDVSAMPVPVLLHLRNAPEPSNRGTELLRASFPSKMSVTSDSAARLTTLIAELAADGKQAGLNSLSNTAALPLQNPTDWSPLDPLTVSAFAGKARVAAAWQLVEVFREFRPVRPVLVAILDAGFWLDGFAPAVAPGQPASDFGAGVLQMNLMDEGVSAGGASGMPTKNGFDYPWHGNAAASVAAARVGNGLGAAGVGGTVATPVLFKTDGSLDYYFRCLQICLAWGVDVLNMSISHTTGSEFFFPTTAWNNSFRSAADAGLIMVASAGNDSKNLPYDDDHPRPATRTPGTITVGAIDGNYQAQDYSNYGPSVNVWAPTDIPVIPNENSPLGDTFGGTSAAAPFVAGIMAMMRAVSPAGTPGNERARQLLQDSCWTGSGRVGRGVDAYAAILATIGGHLPDAAAESHATAQTALLLKPGAGGLLMPFRRPSDPRRDVLSSASHSNWYKFEASTFVRFDLQLRSYSVLGPLLVSLEPDDESSRALTELSQATTPGFTHFVGFLAPGAYRVHVLGGAINMYDFQVSIVPSPLPLDDFERNDTFETSTRFNLFEPGVTAPLSLDRLAGSYNLSLHVPGDNDFLRIEPFATNPLSIPVLRVDLTDAPVDITVFNAAREVIDRQIGKRTTKVSLPRTVMSFVQISGNRPTRYRLTLRLEVDPAHLPGALQGQESIPLPDLGDPPFRIDDGMNHILFNAEALATSGVIVLAAVEGTPLKVDLLDDTGKVVRTARRGESSLEESVEMDLKGIQSGAHLLRVEPAAATSGSTGATPAKALTVQRLPSFR